MQKMPQRRGAAPSPEAIALLLANGYSYRKIAEGTSVSGERIRQIAAAHGLKSERGRARLRHERFLPWRYIRPDHKGDTLYRRLLALSRRGQGRELKPNENRLVDEFVAFMDGANRWNSPLSVHYSRDEGFWLEPRQPGDQDFVHFPARER